MNKASAPGTPELPIDWSRAEFFALWAKATGAGVVDARAEVAATLDGKVHESKGD